MLKIEIHPDVYSELELSRAWYEEKATNLGTEFLDEIESAPRIIEEAPDMWPWYEKDKESGAFSCIASRTPYFIDPLRLPFKS